LGVTPKTILCFLLCLTIFKTSAQSVRAVLQPTITVSDLDRVLPFYTQTLPFELVGIQAVPASVIQNLFGLATPGTTAGWVTKRWIY
jgi:hypothetical protein